MAAARELIGSETPRIWTPPARPLTPKTTLGFEAVEFGRDVAGIDLFPWQRWLLIHGLELHPDFTSDSPAPLFRFDTVVALAARQNGKTEVMKVLALWKIYLDRQAGQTTTVIGTSQDLSNSEKAWKQAVSTAMSSADLAAEIEHIDKTNGQKSLRLIDEHEYRVAAASRRGARGFTGDLVLLDELREHQSWESWGASTKTTLARPRSQAWCFSNAGDAASIVLWHLRAQAMATAEGVAPGELEAFAGPAAAEDVDDEDAGVDSLAIFEWSAPPKASKWDRSAWAQANPSLPHTITERKLAAAARTDPEWTYRTEVMCLWRPTAAGGPFDDGAWEEGVVADGSSEIAADSLLGVGVDVSFDRSFGYVAVAGYRADGHIHVEIAARRAGTDWIIPWLKAPERPRWAAITAQQNGAPVSTLLEQFTRVDTETSELGEYLVPGLPWLSWQGADLARACGRAYDLVRLPNPNDPDDAGKLRLFHNPQPVLDVPASTAATRPIGDGWVIDRRRSPTDAAPVVAVVAAIRALELAEPPEVSAYETGELLVI